MKKWILLAAGVLLSFQSAAIPLPDFIVYGSADTGANVAAYWRDQPIASGEENKGLYKLSIPMGTAVKHRKGDPLEIWVNGTPTGQTVTVGEFGTAYRHDL